MTTDISLIIPNYNRDRYLAEAIESVLTQTYRDFELVVWDDGSDDRSLAIARQYAQIDPRVRVVAAQHQGIAPALKSAIATTTGTYLGWVDSDDRLAPTALAETVAVLNAQPQVGLVYTHYQVIDEQGHFKRNGTRCTIPYSPERLLLNFMTFHFRLLRRSVYEQVGGIDPTFEWAEDYDLCLKLSEVTEVRQIPAPLYFYRRHAHNLTNNKLESIRWAARAIGAALDRRGLSDHYQLEVEISSTFSLKPKAQSPPDLQPAIVQIIPRTPPLVSILIPCYNAAARIEACLTSCLQQTYPQLEIIVVDNNSTDGSIDRVKQLAQDSAHPIQLQSCRIQGANAARATAFCAAQGEYIQWLDADDELTPNKIAAQVALLEQRPDCQIAYSDWEWRFYGQQHLSAQFIFSGYQYEDFLLQLLVDNWRPPHAYLVRRSVAAQLHNMQAWNPETIVYMDREYFTLAALLGSNFLYVPDASVYYCHWNSTQVSRSASYWERVQSRRRLFRRFQDVAQARCGSIHKLHWSLLRQSWELWSPAFSLHQLNPDCLLLEAGQEKVLLDHRAALIARALLQSPQARTLEDQARKIVQQLWCGILVRLNRSAQPEQVSNFALIAAELGRILALSQPLDAKGSNTKQKNCDVLLSANLVNDVQMRELTSQVGAWLPQLPLFSPLFGEHRLLVHRWLERFCDCGWLRSQATNAQRSSSCRG